MALKNNRVNINDGGSSAKRGKTMPTNDLQNAYNDYRKSYVKNDISASKPINNGGGQMMSKTLARKVDNGGQMMNRRIKAPTKTNVVPGKKREKSAK